MSKKLYILIAAVLLTVGSYAQSPELMSYQAGVRDSNDALVTNIQIGAGTLVSGPMNTIDWGAADYFIKTEIDIDTDDSYDITGISQLLSVPYALHAKTVSQPVYTVDTFYKELGGYIIEINTDGTHGLVVAMQDQGIASWYEVNDLLNNADNHDAYGAKFKDWRLPTKRELQLMYTMRISIGGFITNYYWSSTEVGNFIAWKQIFIYGNQDVSDKYFTYLVRAVRAF